MKPIIKYRLVNPWLFLTVGFLFLSFILISTQMSLMHMNVHYLGYLISFFAAIPVISLTHELKSYFLYGVLRFHSYSKALCKASLCYALMAGFSVSFSFFLYLLHIELLNISLFIENISDLASITSDFGAAFLLKRLSIFFAFGFSLGLLACGVVLWTKSSIYAVLLPVLYYAMVGFMHTILGVFFSLLLTTFLGLVLIITGSMKQKNFVE